MPSIDTFHLDSEEKAIIVQYQTLLNKKLDGTFNVGSDDASQELIIKDMILKSESLAQIANSLDLSILLQKQRT